MTYARIILVLHCMFFMLPNTVMAATWEICDLQLKILKPKPNEHLLFTEVISVENKRNAECPKAGDSFNFRPESADYQSMIPRRDWPKVNQLVSVRYRYLDGICKTAGPCRIKHYSLMKR